MIPQESDIFHIIQEEFGVTQVKPIILIAAVFCMTSMLRQNRLKYAEYDTLIVLNILLDHIYKDFSIICKLSISKVHPNIPNIFDDSTNFKNPLFKRRPCKLYLVLFLNKIN